MSEPSPAEVSETRASGHGAAECSAHAQSPMAVLDERHALFGGGVSWRFAELGDHGQG
jgi:hypothetical protein